MSTFAKDLEALLNHHSMENESGTPDFILAEFLRDALDAYNVAVKKREIWYGRGEKPMQPAPPTQGRAI